MPDCQMTYHAENIFYNYLVISKMNFIQVICQTKNPVEMKGCILSK